MGFINTLMDVGSVFPDVVTNEWVNAMPRRTLTKEEMNLSYSKYYGKDMALIPEEDLDAVNAGPVSPFKALSIKNRNHLLLDGYLDIETGYCLMEDGTGMAATKVFMPDVTPEMLDWWFNWHPLEPLRYAIWCPIGHTSISAQTPEAHRDSSGIDRHIRNYGKKHYPVEGFDLKGAETIEIQFYNPVDLGYDAALIPDVEQGCIHTATVSRKLGFTAVPINIFTHAVRVVEGGVEYRSRYWLGWTVNKKGEIVKSKIPFPKKFMESMARNNCIHSLTEYNNLASILPDIYREQKGKIE